MDYGSIADELAADHGLGKTKSGSSDIDELAKQLADDHGIDLKVKPSERLRVQRDISPVAPPISGASKEESDIRNREIQTKPVSTDTTNPRGGIEQYPIRAGEAALESVKSGAAQARQGLGEAFSGQPASGVKDVGSGLASVAGAPIEGVRQAVGDITGSSDIANRAALVAGSALPIDMGVSKAKAMIPSNKAFKTLVESIGPENVDNVAREMRANPRLAPVDLSPKVLQDTQHLFVTEGPHQNYLANSVEGRLQSAKQSAENAFTGAMGSTVDPVQKLAQLSNNIKAVGAKEINPVLKNTKPVDLTPVIEHIDSVLKPGVTHVISNPESMLPYDKVQKLLEGWRNQITNKESGVVLTNPDVLNKIQSNIRRQAESLMRTPDAESKAMGYALFGVRNKIIDAIDKSGENPGAYRAALSKYRDENNIATAFEHGHDTIISNSRKLEDRPEFFENWLKSASKEEKEAAQEGARVAIDTAINGYRTAATNPASKGVQIAQVDFNRQRIEALFGKEEAEKLFKKLEDERKIADSNTKLVQGSQTAMRNASKAQFTLPTPSDAGKALIPPAILEGANVLAGGPGGAASALYGGIRGAAYAKDKIAMKLAKEHNASYAKLALPVEGPQREELIKSLEAVASKQKPSMLSRANRVARLFGP